MVARTSPASRLVGIATNRPAAAIAAATNAAPIMNAELDSITVADGRAPPASGDEMSALSAAADATGMTSTGRGTDRSRGMEWGHRVKTTARVSVRIGDGAAS